MSETTKIPKITPEEHGELCVYLDDWLCMVEKIRISTGLSPELYETMKLYSDTLSDLLAIDAIEAGL